MLILKERIKKLVRLIKAYLKNETPEGMHVVRIALRRLRFNLELFYNIYDRKKFLNFYGLLVKIQDATGSVRDIYIINKNISLFEDEQNISIPDWVVLKIEEKQKRLIEDLRTELNAFVKSDGLKNFLKLL